MILVREKKLNKDHFLPELFKCFICKEYKAIEDMKILRIKGLILPKDVCIQCYNKIIKSIKSKGENHE